MTLRTFLSILLTLAIILGLWWAFTPKLYVYKSNSVMKSDKLQAETLRLKRTYRVEA